jgi:hypothetical protein
MERLRRLALLVVAPLVVATGPVVATAWASPAGAVNPGPQQIPLVAGSPPGVSCPGGTYVAINPGPQQSSVFVLVNPGPTQCPQGSDMLMNLGTAQAPTGQAVALPLTAKSCAAGTALLNQERTMLGSGTPGGLAPAHKGPRRAAGCPSGDAALAALHAALANVPVAPGGSGFITPGSFGPPTVASGSFFTVDPGSVVAAPACTGGVHIKKGEIECRKASNNQVQKIVFNLSASGTAIVKLAQFSPVVTVQPVSQSAPQGSSITFTASAVGNPFPTVQWQFSTNGGGTWTNDFPPFGTSTTINTGPLFAFMNGWENRAVFTNSLGTAISDPATMTVTP